MANFNHAHFIKFNNDRDKFVSELAKEYGVNDPIANSLKHMTASMQRALGAMVRARCITYEPHDKYLEYLRSLYRPV